MFPQDDDPSAGTGETDETELERWQRNFMELLQELRVAQTGVQILFAFLLTLAFRTSFDRSDTFVRMTYLVALLSAAAATALLIAPVAYHRVLFRRHRKPSLVRSAHRMASGGLALVVVSMVSAVMLAADQVTARWIAVLIAAATGVWFTYLWAIAPWNLRERD